MSGKKIFSYTKNMHIFPFKNTGSLNCYYMIFMNFTQHLNIMFGPLHIHIFSLGLSLIDFVSSVLGKEKMCSIKEKFSKYSFITS